MSPVHPAVVHFPIGLTFGSVVADTAAALKGWSSLASAGGWMLLGAAAGAVVAVSAGYWDMRHDDLREQTHKLVHLHLKFGWAILLTLLGMSVWRLFGMRLQAEPDAGYLFVGWILIALVSFQGWFGGELVFGHGAGVALTGQGQEPIQQATERSLRVYQALSGRSAKGGRR